MTQSIASLEERLAHHPELQKRFEQILSIAEAEGSHLQRADEVELQVIDSSPAWTRCADLLGYSAY